MQDAARLELADVPRHAAEIHRTADRLDRLIGEML